MKRALPFAICLGILAIGGRSLPAEVFHLRGAGLVRGEISNKDENPRVSYVVKTPSGGTVTLAAADVEKIDPQNRAEIAYDRTKLNFPDTAQGHWELAEYCKAHHLTELRTENLQRAIELEPDHAEARHALGFTQVKGKWITQQEGMSKDGRIRYQGDWLTAQEIDIKERERKGVLAEKNWMQQIKRFRSWIDKGKVEQGRAAIAEINDPYAAKGLAHFLAAEHDREFKMMWVEALARLNAAVAFDALLKASMDEPDEEVRIACMERLKAANYKPAVRTYIKLLHSKDNPTVNRAAIGLSYMNDASAVSALIDALVTKHKFTLQPGGSPGQMSTSFGGPTGGGGGGGGGGSPGGFGFGAPQPVVVEPKLENPEVLKTLVALSGQNFDFNVTAWKYWYANQKKPSSMDARRD